MKFLSQLLFTCLFIQGSMVFAAQQSCRLQEAVAVAVTTLPPIQETSVDLITPSHCYMMNLALEQLFIKKSQQRLQALLAQTAQSTASDAKQDEEMNIVPSSVLQKLIQKRAEHCMLFERYCRENLFNRAADEVLGMVQTYEPQLVQQAAQELLAASQFFISKNENQAAERLLQQCSFLPVERKNEIAELRACMAPAPTMIQPNNNNQRKIVTAKRHNK